MKKVFVEIELDGFITSKRLSIPKDIISDMIKQNQYIRGYYKKLGYKVGEYLRVC